MVFGVNKLENASGRKVWCAYSVKDPNGGKWELWRVRLLHPGYVSNEVDIDYIKPESDNVTMNGRTGWWKLGQLSSFYIGSDVNHSSNLVLVSPSGGSIRHFDEWALGNNRFWYEKLKGTRVYSQEDLDGLKREWDSLKDAASPIEKEG